VDVRDGIILVGEELGYAVGGRGGVVPSHGNQQGDLVLDKEVQIEVLLKILVGGFEPAHLEVRTTPVEDLIGEHEVKVNSAGGLGEQSGVSLV